MSKLIKIVYNATTGEIFEVELNNAEIEQYEADQAAQAAQAAARAQALAAKAAAQAKLAALGLTTDDLKALGLGGNE